MTAEFSSIRGLPAESLLPLQALPRGARGVIENLGSPAQEGDREVLLRLLEIGFLPGETVRVIAHGRRGAEPVAVRIGQATFALRAREAALIRVRPLAAEQEHLA
ncbi:MAG: FeoA family protein [Ottowia sp.]|uniref:FeoA family protein n=1 Tax=Ottowia sp. TaxID=1898956 RepID=UPI003C76D35D